MIGSAVILSGCGQYVGEDKPYEGPQLERYGQYNSRVDTRSQPRFGSKTGPKYSEDQLRNMAREEGYLKGHGDAMKRVEGTVMSDFPYRYWQDPIIQTVDMPAMVVGGSFIPAHSEMVVIEPGSWKENFGYPIQVDGRQYRLQGQPQKQKVPSFGAWEKDYRSGDIQPVHTDSSGRINQDEMRGLDYKYEKRTEDRSLEEKIDAPPYDYSIKETPKKPTPTKTNVPNVPSKKPSNVLNDAPPPPRTPEIHHVEEVKNSQPNKNEPVEEMPEKAVQSILDRFGLNFKAEVEGDKGKPEPKAPQETKDKPEPQNIKEPSVKPEPKEKQDPKEKQNKVNRSLPTW